ncbi:MAG: hypothetical protein EOM01_13720 [Spirochaetia bacterium]|nr:hypothetical protein [Spirochaetia bacterium]
MIQFFHNHRRQHLRRKQQRGTGRSHQIEQRLEVHSEAREITQGGLTRYNHPLGARAELQHEDFSLAWIPGCDQAYHRKRRIGRVYRSAAHEKLECLHVDAAQLPGNRFCVQGE